MAKTKVFVEENTFTAVDNDLVIFGSTAKLETVRVASGVTGQVLDGNIERFEVAGNLADYKFVAVAGTGLQIQNAAGVTVATVATLNQNATVAFANGSVVLAQTGSTAFTLGGQAVSTTTAAPVVATLNAADVSTVGGSTPGTTPVDSFTLTNGTDVATANVFTAGLVYTPGGDNRINALQDEDHLTGLNGAADDVLNATMGNANDNGATTITPHLSGIEVINASFTGSGTLAVVELDLQDSDGVTKAININRISDGTPTATIDNIAAVPATLSVSNSGQTNQNVSFAFEAAAVVATDNTTKMALSNVNLGELSVQGRGGNAGGIETINIESNGSANFVRQFTAQDVKTLNISGSQDLSLRGIANTVRPGAPTVEATQFTASLNNVAGSLTKIDASTMTGNLTLALGAEIDAGLDNTSGVSVQAQVTGGKGNDTFILTAGANIGGTVGNTDIIDGGEGANTMIMVGNTTIAAAATANVRNIQALDIRSGHDLSPVADTVTVNAAAFDKLATIKVRNEGQEFGSIVAGAFVADPTGAVAGGFWQSVSEGMTVNLNNLTAAQATGITVAHGTTGNSTIANNIVGLTFAAAGTANASQVTIVDGINADPVFNLRLNANSSELVTLVDNDSESNTVSLNQAGFTQAGSTITLQGGRAAQYMSLDTLSTGAVVAAAATNNGYGQFTNGTAANNTTVLTAASAAAVAIGGIATRDTAAASVFYGTAGAAGDLATRVVVENVAAGTYLGDVQIRVGDLTRADGVTSQKITTGIGNDTVIFDAIGATNSGFTSADTVAMGTGTDTLVIDGNTATVAGTPRIDIQSSEWDNLTGVDILRFGNNAGVGNVGNAAQVTNAGGAYYARIDNDFITQTDATNRLTIMNNDGDLTNNTESDLVLDGRDLSQSKFITFVGANSNGIAGISSNRIVLDDVSANQNMILNGGDTDVRINTTPGYVAGNNNVYEVRNTANVSISDLAQTSNFGLIDFTNDQATPQTLTLTLNNTIVEVLVDSSSTASAIRPETLNVTATDGVLGSQSNLNIDARQVTGFHALNVTGSATGNDVVYVDANVGGSGHTLNLGAGFDTVFFSGAASTFTGDISAAAGTFVVGTETGITLGNTAGSTVTHLLGAAGIVENIDLSGLTGLTIATTTLTGAATTSYIGGTNVATVADTITGNIGMAKAYGYAGIDFITLAATTVAGLIGSGAALAGAIVGNTLIDGGAGDDTITGSNVAAITDRIIGGTGLDNMTGGLGDDIYVINAGDSGITALTADTITDFATTVDKLDLFTAGTAANFVDGATGAATYASALIAANIAFSAVGSTVRYFFDDDSTDGFFFADTNADGAADLSINLTGVTALVAADII